MKTSQIFQIPVGRIQDVSGYLVKLQNRAAKIGGGIFTFVIDETIKSRTFKVESEEGNFEASYQYRELTIEQDVIVHEGWVPIAKVLVPEKQIKSFQSFTKEMEKMSDEYLYNNHCDHCNKNLIKVKSFVMQKGNEFMKVGSGCMHQLAPANARSIAASFDIGQMWQKYLNDMSRPVDGEGSGRKWFGGGGGIDANIVYDKNELLTALGAVLADDGGWVTSEHEITSRGLGEIINRGKRTFDHVGTYMNRGIMSQLPNPSYVSQVNKMFEEFLNSEAADKMVDVVKTDSVTGREEVIGTTLVDYIPQAKTFHEASKVRLIDIFLVKKITGIMERLAIKNIKRGSEFVGVVGEKMALELEFVEIRSGEGQFGTWHLWTFKDTNGNFFKKFGQVNERFKISGDKDGNHGVYKFMAPIKDHEVYDDIKYTLLGGPFSKVKELKKMKVA